MSAVVTVEGNTSLQTEHVGQKPGKGALRRQTAKLFDPEVEIVVLI
jgi:hypothetical protein